MLSQLSEKCKEHLTWLLEVGAITEKDGEYFSTSLADPFGGKPMSAVQITEHVAWNCAMHFYMQHDREMYILGHTTKITFVYPCGTEVTRICPPNGRVHGIRHAGKRPIKAIVHGNISEEEYYKGLRRALDPNVDIEESIVVHGEIVKYVG